MEKKKILVLVDWFAPGYKAGGPIQSCINFAFAMKSAYSVFVLTTDTDHGETEPYPGIVPDVWTHDIHPDIAVCYLRKKGLKPAAIRKQIAAVQPDFIYLNHLFSPLFVVYPLWLKYRGATGSRIVVCPRGALYESALSVKRWKKTPFLQVFRRMKLHRRVLFHATNQREKEAILQHFPGSTVLIADNLPNMKQPPFTPAPKEKGVLRCIFISRIFPIKNLLFLLQVLATVKARVYLSVIGPAEDTAYWDECRRVIGGLPENITVEYLGPKRNDELMGKLHEHHLFILPTTGENFGHAIFESLLSGRPVLISDQTPWLGLPARKAGWDLPLADREGFARVIETVAQWDQAQFDEWAHGAWDYARKFIENPDLQDQYLQLFQ